MGRILKRSKSFVLGVCDCGCGNTVNIKTASCRLQRFAYCHNMIFLHKMGSESSHYKTGKFNDTRGYILTLQRDHHFANNDGYVYQHRLVWEQEHSASLLSWADIHHKDGNRHNNVWYNLTGMMKAQHTHIHSKKDMSNRLCIICNQKTYVTIQGYERWFRHPITKQEWVCRQCYRKI